MKDLLRLFGAIEEDDQGKPYILVEDPDPAGGFGAETDDEDYVDDI